MAIEDKQMNTMLLLQIERVKFLSKLDSSTRLLNALKLLDYQLFCEEILKLFRQIILPGDNNCYLKH